MFGNSGTTVGGVQFSGEIAMKNTLIAGSVKGNDCGGNSALTANVSNFVEDASCSASLSGNPKLGALASGGGPTQTLALLVGSPAIDAGDDAVCAAAPVSKVDQRGTARPQGVHCDIGAFELVP
ncbi:MAG: hypothetical protein EXR77_19920 [Myxococcales bacterium]|nr:hypothetical protein [Myxococcales bacterium]